MPDEVRISGVENVTALEQLAEKIHTAHELGFLSVEFDQLARAALKETLKSWLREPQFRERKGVGYHWCVNHFAQYEKVGQARKQGQRRWWREDALPDTDVQTTEDAIFKEMVGSS